MPSASPPTYSRGLNEPYRHNGIDIDLTASLGIAVYPDHGTDPAMLWRDADTAMYRAKKSGGNQYMYVSQEISAATLEATELEKHLRRALKDGGLELHYQPLYTTRWPALRPGGSGAVCIIPCSGWFIRTASSRSQRRAALSCRSATGCSTSAAARAASGRTAASTPYASPSTSLHYSSRASTSPVT